MPHFTKPAEGSWTQHYPELGTAPVNYEDSISPEHYELERDAIFRKTWLNVGRVEQLPRKGSFFTKELDCARTSVIIVKGQDEVVRAFHNTCRHRGNKLVWNDFPQEEEFFDFDKADYGLAAVQCEVWEGFIFVNLDPANDTPLAGYMGELGAGLAGYPFDQMTQVYKLSLIHI